jgi:hypothetical protein
MIRITITAARRFPARGRPLGARRLARVGRQRRIEKAPLNLTRQPMHQALADLAGLSLHLELGGDLLQKLRPPLLIDRPGQAHQNGHLVVVQLPTARGIRISCQLSG